MSHFRPFKDFTRISILNTVLVIITLIYIKPRDFFRSFKKKSFKDFLREDILDSTDSNLKKSLSIALGTFIGISPFWGFQTILAIFLAVTFRLNKLLAFTFSNISFPPLIPFIIYGSLVVGSYFVTTETKLVFDTSITFTAIKNNMFQYLVGSFILALLTAFILGLLSFLVLTFFNTFKNKN